MKKFLCMFLVACLLFGLIGCSGAESNKDESSANQEAKADSSSTTYGIDPMKEKTTINIGYFSGTLHAVPFYIMEQEGWLEELNIEFNYQSFVNGPAMMEANNSWDIGTAGAPGAITGILGYDVSVIGICDHEAILNLYVREESPIYQSGNGNIEGYEEIYGTPEDWKGTTWILPVGTTMHQVFASTLSKMNLTLNDVTIINMDVTSALAGFKAGEGDGLGCWISIALSAEEAGYKKVGGADVNSDIVATAILANDAALADETKFEAITKIYELYYKTIEWCYQNEDEFAQHFYDTCEIEGVACSEEVAKEVVTRFKSFELDYMLEHMTSEVDDKRELASRKLNGAESDLMETFDFFMDIESYTEENRNYILDNNKITNVVAKAIKEKQ